jgi:transposase
MNSEQKRTVELDDTGWPTQAWLERVYLEEGLGTRDIAQLTGRGVGRISMLLRKYRIPTRQPPPLLEREWLESHYRYLGVSIQEIAAEAGVTYAHVVYSLQRHHIPTRRKTRTKVEKPTSDWLREKYVVEGLSTAQICEMTGYSAPGLLRLMREYGIERQGQSLPKLDISREELYELHVVQGLTAVRIAARLGCHNATISRLIRQYQLDPGRPLVNARKEPPLTREELWKLYWVDGLSAGSIAKRYHVSVGTVRRWFHRREIEMRAWNGGDFSRTYTRSQAINRNNHEFSTAERDRIIQRDGNLCRMPGCGKSQRLEVHHILPIKAGGSHDVENGITLCHDCHESILGREMGFVLLFQELVLNP